MATQQRDLLRTIAREPDDDFVRLVYADWLEEHDGEDRAALIRAAVRLNEIRRAVPPPDEISLWSFFGLSPIQGTWHCPGDSPERRELAFRCRRLLDAHEQEWLTPFSGLLRHDWVWSRGFVETVDVDPASLAGSGQELFDIHPIRRLILTGLRGNVDLLAFVPTDNRLTALDLILNNLDLNALQKLTRFGHFHRLTELNLSYNRLGDSTIDFLRGEPFFQGLSLDLSCNPFTEEGRQRLREHFGSRVTFKRERHPNRLFAFPADAGMRQSHPEQTGTVNMRAGTGRDYVQLFLEELAHADTLTVFDYAGDLLHVETRAAWGQQEPQRREEKEVWLQSFGYEPATIKVKRFPGVYDYPKSWSAQLDCAYGEPEDYDALAFIERWLTEGGFRYGAFCGGLWLNRKTGKTLAL